eukprot:10849956-Lingulodinium_polyedra.AAC.1
MHGGAEAVLRAHHRVGQGTCKGCCLGAQGGYGGEAQRGKTGRNSAAGTHGRKAPWGNRKRG